MEKMCQIISDLLNHPTFERFKEGITNIEKIFIHQYECEQCQVHYIDIADLKRFYEYISQYISDGENLHMLWTVFSVNDASFTENTDNKDANKIIEEKFLPKFSSELRNKYESLNITYVQFFFVVDTIRKLLYNWAHFNKKSTGSFSITKEGDIYYNGLKVIPVKTLAASVARSTRLDETQIFDTVLFVVEMLMNLITIPGITTEKMFDPDTVQLKLTNPY